ncbi:hypothetical protein [Miniphocaeibacter halophilus]|uniref:Uncharacterized protein n=1 Tax=Miniphocaeibacter halophilus TaxID=2931922 RepID=A0AC61MQL4_9FIRM|nr:hypothetical protein [Miniphocaeibacter halophilus]QQK07899.1 hypothetical protein JFY71_11600 [Miniphocaeibacter halophilus]
MKKSKKILLFLLLIGTLIMLTSCKFSVKKLVDQVVGIKGEMIYNSDRKIKGSGNSYSISNYNIEVEDNSIIGDFKYFSGLYDLAKIESKGNNKVTYKTNIESDTEDFKIVVISPEKEIAILGEGNGSNEELIEFTEGESHLKMVGKGGKGKYNLEFDKNDNIEITRILDED